MAAVSSGERAAQARSVHRALGTENLGGVGFELGSRTEGGKGSSAASFIGRVGLSARSGPCH